MKKQLVIPTLFLATMAVAFQPVDINQASLEQIALLPGVGKKLSSDIIAYRKKVGHFHSVHQLSAVGGMTSKKLDQITPHVIVQRAIKARQKGISLSPEPQKIILTKKAVIALDVLEAKALKSADLGNDIDHSFSARARKAAWLPKLQASVGLEHDRLIAEKKGESSRDSLVTRGGRDFDIGVRLVFELDKLIFNTDELEIAKLSLKRLEKREEVIGKLHKHYFRYCHLIGRLDEPLEREVAQNIQREMSELEAALDSMTKGEFTKFQTISLTNQG